MKNKARFALTYLEFIATRLFGTGVDLLVLWVCSTYIFSTYWEIYVLSPIISFEFAVLSNFLWSYFWIWSSRIPQKTWRSFWKSFIIFNLSSVVGFLVKMFFLLLAEKIFEWNVLMCNITALLVSGIFNFFLADSLVFRQKKSKLEAELGVEPDNEMNRESQSDECDTCREREEK